MTPEHPHMILNCPHCNHRLSIKTEHIGIKGACVNCKSSLIAIEMGDNEYKAIPAESSTLNTNREDKRTNHTPNLQAFSTARKFNQQADFQHPEIPSQTFQKCNTQFENLPISEAELFEQSFIQQPEELSAEVAQKSDALHFQQSAFIQQEETPKAEELEEPEPTPFDPPTTEAEIELIGLKADNTKQTD